MEENKIITPSLIFLDEDLKNKTDIIKHIAKAAMKINYIEDENDLFDAVMQREAEIPTAIGHFIAIPHGKTDSVNTPFIAFLRTKEKFIWTENYDEEVKLVFLIGVPKQGTERLYLKFISQVSKKLMNEKFREELINIENKDTIYKLLSEIEV